MRTSRTVQAARAIWIGLLLCIGGCASLSSRPQLSADAQAEALSQFTLGLLAEANGDTQGALSYFETALSLDPGEGRLYAAAAAAALKLKLNDKAEALADQYMKHCPNDREALIFAGGVYSLTQKYDKAEELFRKITRLFPDDTEAFTLLGRLYLSRQKTDEALQSFLRATEADPNDADLLQLIGTLMIESSSSVESPDTAEKSIRKGIEFLQKALKENPNNTFCRRQLGYAFLMLKDTDNALEIFKEEFRLHPDDSSSARAVLDLLLVEKQYGQALRESLEIAEKTGENPEAWFLHTVKRIPEGDRQQLTDFLEEQIREQECPPVYFYTQLGAEYLEQNDIEKAEKLIRIALEKYPDSRALRIALGYLDLKKERFDDAYRELSLVRTESNESEWSSNPFFLYNFIVAAQKSGRLDDAAQVLASSWDRQPAVLNEYIRNLLTGQSPISTEAGIDLLNTFRIISPKVTETDYYLMLLRTEQQNYNEALKAAEQFEKMATEAGETNLLTGAFYYQYAAVNERIGNIEKAEKLFFRAIELGEDETIASAQNYVAYMWAERGEKLPQSLELIQKALAVDPENGAFLDTLGWIYYMQGHYAEALAELKKAVTVINDDPILWEHLGDTYFKLGDKTAAIKHWQKAFELDPEDPSALKRLEENNAMPAETPE